MGFKVIKPDELSIEPVEKRMPVLPREEAHRMRKAARQSFDALLPEAIRVIQDALLSEDMDDRKWGADKVLKAVLASAPNEITDPEAVTVDGSVTSKDDLKMLEDMTQDGTGALDPDPA